MSKEKDFFVHLHQHSDYSQLDGCAKPDTYAKLAATRGNPALALTDHGTVRGYFSHHMACEKHGIASIHGVELYIAKDANRKGVTDEERAEITKGIKNKSEQKEAVAQFEEREGIRDRWHLTVWAKNNEGLRNLSRITSRSWQEGFYYKPRVDLNQLIAHKEGLMVATGCLSSPINDRVIQGKRKAAFADADRLWEAFGEDMWLEVQPHNIDIQETANRFILGLQDRYPGARLLATQDAHYAEQEDAEHHEVLLCVGTGKNLSDPNRFKFDGDEFFMKTRKQMFSTFKKNHSYMTTAQIKEALNSTIDFAEMCTAKVEIDHLKAVLPVAPVPDEYRGNDWRYVKDLCVQGWTWREIAARAAVYGKVNDIPFDKAIEVYKNRLTRELKEIKEKKFVGYFLIVQDLYKWMRSSKIAVGPGRGSAAGSLVSFLLGITAVDPIEHGLMFERFIAPGRGDLPDIDMDLEDVRRQEVIEHLKEIYGSNKVCQIATVSKLSGKEVVKSVARVLEVPYAEANAITDSILERSSGDERAFMTVEDSFKEFQVLKDFNKLYPAVLHHARKLEGMSKNLGIHAAGVIITPDVVSEFTPLESRKSDDGTRVSVSALDMYGVAALGLLKLDLLGLRTLSSLNDALKEIKRRHGKDIDLEKIPLDMEDVLQGFTDSDFVGIFQYDSPGSVKLCAGVEFTQFGDIATMTALNRPGTSQSGLATSFLERKKDPRLIKKSSFHPAVSEITKDTLGVIVFQEHVIRIFTNVAGFSPIDADKVRKKIGKRVGAEELDKDRAAFISGCLENTPGMTKEISGKLMDAIVFFGKYAFNKAHSVCYGFVGYMGMYLKKQYPLEFYVGLLKNETKKEKIERFAKDAKKHGIVFMAPSVNTSGKNFRIDDSMKDPTIRGSLIDIKGVGDKAADSIVQNQPFSSFSDFLNRVNRRVINKGVVPILVKSGAMSEIVPNSKWFLEHFEECMKLYERNPELLDVFLKKSAKAEQYAPEEAQLIASKVNPLSFGDHPMSAYTKFIEEFIQREPVSMSDPEFFKKYDGKNVLIAGVIVDTKLSQVGDYHSGTLPSEDERTRMFWGSRYANVNVEDQGGTQNRIKFDIDTYEPMRTVIEAGAGTPVYVHVSVNGQYENLKAHFAVDLEALRKKIKDESGLNCYERLLLGKHPVLDILPKDNPDARERVYRNLKYKRTSVDTTEIFYGLVTNVRLRFDKNGNEMAFFGIIGGDGYFLDCVCFSSCWLDVKSIIRAGELLKIDIDKKLDRERKSISHIYNGGTIKLIKKERTEK